MASKLNIKVTKDNGKAEVTITTLPEPVVESTNKNIKPTIEQTIKTFNKMLEEKKYLSAFSFLETEILSTRDDKYKKGIIKRYFECTWEMFIRFEAIIENIRTLLKKKH